MIDLFMQPLNMGESECNINYKLQELEQEMKRTGLWHKDPPDWVNYFDEKSLTTGQDFSEWLQYVFIPNHLKKPGEALRVKERSMLVPSAIRFFGDDLKRGKLLQVLIEIDALL